MKKFPEPRVLMDAVSEKFGDGTQKHLAGALERAYGVEVQQSSVSRWLKGGGFSYENVMMLLHAAGWLNETAIQAAARRADRGRLTEAARRLSDLAEREERAPRRKQRRQEP